MTTDPDLTTFRQQVSQRLAALADDARDSLAPHLIDLDDALGDHETQIASLLIKQGRADVAHARSTWVIDWLRTAIRCYRTDLQAREGTIADIRVIDTESHHRGRRPVFVETTHGTRWVFKHRISGGDAFLTGRDGVFARLMHAAEGLISLPLNDIRRSTHAPDLIWQRWVDPPQRQAVSGEVSAAAVTGHEGERSWRGIGNLSGVCAALGVTDLGEENVVTRATEPDGVQLVPIDAECFFEPGVGLCRTMLVSAPAARNHHVGIENIPRSCTGSGPLFVSADGRLVPRERPCRRSRSRSLILDETGGAGYATSLAAYLRGIVDGWVTVLRHRALVVDTARETPALRRRVLRRDTAEYVAALVRLLTDDTGGTTAALPGDPGTEEELRQLADADVPFFSAIVQDTDLRRWHSDMTLTNLGPVLRDAIEYVRDQVPAILLDDEREVWIALGEQAGSGRVAVGLPGSRRRVVFTWTGTKVRLDLCEARTHAPDVRERLLRVQRVDAPLRHAWAAEGFDEESTNAQQLRRLTRASAAWMSDVLDRVGWPGSDVAGPDGAQAAADLAQHLDDVTLQQRAADHAVACALRGHASWSDVAGLIDSVAIAQGQPQVFGTKFRRGDDRPEPYPIRDEMSVERLRASAGLPTLREYADRVERHVRSLSREAAHTS